MSRSCLSKIMYCKTFLVLATLIFVENLSQCAIWKNIPGQFSYAYLGISTHRRKSSSNITVFARSLITCIVHGTRESGCICINYSKANHVCELLFGEIDGTGSGLGEANIRGWQSVTISDALEAAVVSNQCPAGYSLGYEGKCYKMVLEAIPMFTAVTRCEEDGGELVSVQSDSEQQFLCSYLSGGHQFWTSGTFDKGVPYWASTNVNFGYTNWMGAPPTDTANRAVYSDSGLAGCPWAAELFTAQKYFICEYPSTT